MYIFGIYIYLKPCHSRARLLDHYSEIFVVKIRGGDKRRSERMTRRYVDVTCRVDWHAAVRGTARDGSQLKITKILRNDSERRIMSMRKAAARRTDK